MPRSSARDAPSFDDHDQIASRGARCRYPGRDGQKRSGERRRLRDIARSQNRANARTARPLPRPNGWVRSARWPRRACRVYASISPVVPAITDHEIEHLLEAVSAAGAQAAFFIPVRLPFEVAPLFKAWLETHHPDRADKVMNMIQSIRQGRGKTIPVSSPACADRARWAPDLIRNRFAIACRPAGVEQETDHAENRSVPSPGRRAGAAVLGRRSLARRRFNPCGPGIAAQFWGPFHHQPVKHGDLAERLAKLGARCCDVKFGKPRKENRTELARQPLLLAENPRYAIARLGRSSAMPDPARRASPGIIDRV